MAQTQIPAAQILNDSIDTSDLKDKAVTLPKIADVNPGIVLGRQTGSTGTVQEVTPTQGITVNGSAQLTLDVNNLTEDTTPDAANDFVATYDASASSHKKVKLSNLPGGGSGSGDSNVKSITQTAHGFSVGNVLKKTGSNYALAQADSAANAEVVGIVSAVADANTFTLLMGGYIGTLSSLTANTTYFLSASSAGALTVTEPTTAGQVSKPLLNAVSTSAGVFTNMRGVVVTSGSGSDMMTHQNVMSRLSLRF